MVVFTAGPYNVDLRRLLRRYWYVSCVLRPTLALLPSSNPLLHPCLSTRFPATAQFSNLRSCPSPSVRPEPRLNPSTCPLPCDSPNKGSNLADLDHLLHLQSPLSPIRIQVRPGRTRRTSHRRRVATPPELLSHLASTEPRGDTRTQRDIDLED